MTIKTKVSFKEYVLLLYRLTYKKPVMKLLLVVAVAMLVWIAGYYTNILPVPKPTIYQYTTFFLITIVQPTVIYTTIRKNYRSSSHLKEELKIEFTTTEIKMRGDSFYTVLEWAKIYKVQELKDWVLIYQNSLSAVIIPKSSLTGKLREFKHLLQSIRGLTLKLYKN
jgi:hypothetical protein